MGSAYFYHLTQRPLEATLSMLLDKALQAGWRVELRGTRADRITWLDQQLWLGRDDSFLPHGIAGGPQDKDQPILLTPQPLSNPRDCLMGIDGAQITAEEVTTHQRVCILFDATDATGLQTARSQWKALTAAGCKAQYWSEDSGRWEKKAEA